MTEPTVVAEGLAFEVNGVPLVSDASVEASSGQLVAIIGPNGAGKSTLLNLLAGDLRPTRGSVTLAGLDAPTTPTTDLALIRSVLAQRARVDLPYSARQIVELGRFPHRRSQENSTVDDLFAVDEAMTRTGTLDLANRIYSSLSGGEQTLVSLARVLAQDTPIILLDEPTAALDVAHQETALDLVRQIAKRGRTVVAVLHDLNAAAAYADSLLLMSSSRIVAAGHPAEVLEPALLATVYQYPMVVINHPVRGGPLVLPGALGAGSGAESPDDDGGDH